MLGPLKLPSGHQCGAPYDDAASWKQQRSGDRTLHVHKQRLLDEISKMKKTSAGGISKRSTYVSRQCGCTCEFEES